MPKINLKNNIYKFESEFSKNLGINLDTILTSETNGTIESELSEFADTLDNTLYREDIAMFIAMVGLTRIGVDEVDSEDLREIMFNTIWETRIDNLTINDIMEYAQRYYRLFMAV